MSLEGAGGDLTEGRRRHSAWAGVGAAFAMMAFAFAPAAAAQIIGPQDPDKPEVNSPWQAGTCIQDTPTCSVATPDQFFEPAAGHPPVGFTQFIVNTEDGPFGKVPAENLRTVRVDIPTGFTVNPEATLERCDLSPAKAGDPDKSPTVANCPNSKVGKSILVATNPTTGFSQTLEADVFNIEPHHGEPARFGFSILGNDVILETDIEWEGDYHEYFTIHAHKLELPGIPGLEVARVAKNRLVFEGRAGDGTFLTTPPTCLGPAIPGSPFEHVYSTWLRADSFENPDPSFPAASNYVESKIPRKPPEFETSPKNCDDIPFEPSIEVDPNTAQTDSPAGAAVTVNLPEIAGGANQASSHVRSAKVTLPAGMGLNPSAANGLVACSDIQFAKGTRNPVACPEASKVGTVAVDTPPLPDGSLTGSVFVGKQLSSDPTSGNLYRIFVTAESERYDISARLLGKVSADPQTGQLTTTFDDAPLGNSPGSVSLPGLPQVPFKAFRLQFNGGPKAPLTSPPTCGPNTTTTQMTPWSSAGPARPDPDESPSTDAPKTPSDPFSLTALPGGGACPKTLGERPFNPGFSARTTNRRAGAFTTLEVEIARADGQQELKGVDITLPPGHSGKLAGLEYCPEAAIAAAAANSGATEAANSSCPAKSFIGTSTVKVGAGAQPLQMTGKAFLAGPYKGAPLSLAVVTPATTGPFDLGTVVVRVALLVDPGTAQIRAVSDQIPHVYGGALLGIRSVLVRTDRPRFSINPTNCAPLATTGTLWGGGSNPLNPAAFKAFPVSSPFQVTGCDNLDFKPKLFMRLFGAMRRAKNPKLRAVYVAREGDANTARAAVTLPRSLFLDQSSISKVCTRVQYDARDCPKNSIYGHARAFTPLLDDPLEGPVFLRSSDNELPDLVASLRGQVDVDLVGRIDSVKGRIRNVFDTPDVPVSKFVLTIRGGRKGLLTNSRNQCPKARRAKKAKPQRAIARIKAQNGKKANQRPKLRTACGKKKRQMTE